LLKVLALGRKPLGWKTIITKVKQKYREFPPHSVGKFLASLLEKELICQQKRGVYKLPDKMFEEYILRLE